MREAPAGNLAKTIDGALDHTGYQFPLMRAAVFGTLLYLYTLLEWRREHPPLSTLIQGSVLLILSAWWIWKVVRREGVPRSPAALPLVALLGSMILSTTFSLEPRLSLAAVLVAATIVLFFFLFCDLLLVGWRAETFVSAILLCGALTMFRGLAEIVLWYGGWWQVRVPDYPPFLVPYRLFGVANHPNLLAPLVNLGLPFAIVRLTRSKWWGPHAAHGAWMLAATVVLFFTRSRGGQVATAVVVALTLVGLLLESGSLRHGEPGKWLRSLGLIHTESGNFAAPPPRPGQGNSWGTPPIPRPEWALGRPLVWVLSCLALFATLHVTSAALSPSEFNLASGGSVSSIGGRLQFWTIAWDSFLVRPAFGSGPNAYGLLYLSDVDAARGFIAIHAHSIYLTVLSEQGLVGALVLAWLLLSGLAVALRAWRPLLQAKGTSESGLIIAASAALAGFLVHGLVDVPGWLLTNALMVAMLGAVGLRAAGALEKGPSVRARWLAPALVAPLLLVVLVQRQSAGHSALIEGIVHGLSRDWPMAARALDRAVALDPAFTFYHAQRGYAYGVLADSTTGQGDEGALRRSLESYGIVVQTEWAHVPELLNAAWLLEQSGEDEQAERLLRRAVERRTAWALPAMLLAERYVSQGRNSEAEALFEAAFRAETRAREMAACRVSTACRTAARRVPEPTSEIARAHAEAHSLLAEGRARAALEALSEVPVTNADPHPWLDRAEAHLALGEVAPARYSLKVARALRIHDPTREALLDAALRLVEGESRDAIVALETVARPDVGDIPYAGIIWGRPPLTGTLLPSLDLLQRTDDDLTLYRELARLYTLEGRESDAAWANARAKALDALLR